jgi:hypothetical protein
MLERGKLLIRDADSEGSRSIEDAATGEPLGSARPVERQPRWLPARRVLEVREAEDAPLVFTVQRAWSLLSRYDVRDADGRLIGSIAGVLVASRGDRRFALCGPDGNISACDGKLLARVIRTKKGTEIGFADADVLDPFARMLLLAYALRR